MCHCWDSVVRPRPMLAGHFVVAMLAYVAGLCLTNVALIFSWFGSSGQPALVWIVPCMLSVSSHAHPGAPAALHALVCIVPCMLSLSPGSPPWSDTFPIQWSSLAGSAARGSVPWYEIHRACCCRAVKPTLE